MDNEIPKFLILSGEGSSDTENQFVMECSSVDDANENFDTFKKGEFKNTNLYIFEAKLLREE